MFFFFFFDLADNIQTIKKAFEMICFEKMKNDGYIEMSSYINRTISNEEMSFRLATVKSKFINLYKMEYPTKDTIRQVWGQMGFSIEKEEKINRVEAEAILYWAYGALEEKQQRIDQTLSLFGQIKELSSIEYNIVYENGIFYNERKIEIKPIISIASFNSAIANYNKAIELHPKYVDAWVRKGITLYNEKEYYEAETCLNEAVRLSSSSFKAVYNRGKIRLALENTEGALGDLDRAISLKPEHPKAHELFGDALMKVGKEEEAALQWAIAERLREKKKK